MAHFASRNAYGNKALHSDKILFDRFAGEMHKFSLPCDVSIKTRARLLPESAPHVSLTPRGLTM